MDRQTRLDPPTLHMSNSGLSHTRQTERQADTHRQTQTHTHTGIWGSDGFSQLHSNFSLRIAYQVRMLAKNESPFWKEFYTFSNICACKSYRYMYHKMPMPICMGMGILKCLKMYMSMPMCMPMCMDMQVRAWTHLTEKRFQQEHATSHIMSERNTQTHLHSTTCTYMYMHVHNGYLPTCTYLPLAWSSKSQQTGIKEWNKREAMPKCMLFITLHLPIPH